MNTAEPRERRNVVLVELTAFDSVTPLVSGYLESYAKLDDRVRDGYDFDTVTFPISRAADQIEEALKRRNGDIYAFSTYVWNSRLVRRLVGRLLADKSDLPILLGGPQVMHQGAGYLAPETPSLSICNGEGEITFQHYLRQHLESAPDLAAVRGLSFYRDGTLLTTPAQERIADLDQIPSPYLTGTIKPFRFLYALFETNRGCPFKCAYCYWGAAIGARVHKAGMERLEAEIEWFSRSGIVYVYIVDANWGMLKRDVELSRHFLACQKKTGLPRYIHYSNAKNSPERTIEIAEILQDAAGTNTQPIALQTLSERALADVNRSNIKNDVYMRLQARLNQLGASSFIELIWPLPGETLRSFKDGIGLLCEGSAQSICVYPLLLMNNVELMDRRDEYALQTWMTSDPSGESEMVISTRDVGEDDYFAGWEFAFGAFIIYSMRGLFHLARYLHRSGRRSYPDLIDDFVAHVDRRPDSLLKRLRDHALELPNIELSTQGHMTYFCLHENREECDRELAEFAARQPWWQDREARLWFEVDLIDRPYVYRKSAIAAKEYEFELLTMCESTEDGYVVEVPAEVAISQGRIAAQPAEAGNGSRRFKVSHWRDQLFAADPSTPLDRKEKTCYSAILLIESILPRWEESPGASN